MSLTRFESRTYDHRRENSGWQVTDMQPLDREAHIWLEENRLPTGEAAS